MCTYTYRRSFLLNIRRPIWNRSLFLIDKVLDKDKAGNGRGRSHCLQHILRMLSLKGGRKMHSSEWETSKTNYLKVSSDWDQTNGQNLLKNAMNYKSGKGLYTILDNERRLCKWSTLSVITTPQKNEDFLKL